LPLKLKSILYSTRLEGTDGPIPARSPTVRCHSPFCNDKAVTRHYSLPSRFGNAATTTAGFGLLPCFTAVFMTDCLLLFPCPLLPDYPTAFSDMFLGANKEGLVKLIAPRVTGFVPLV
jgi:hypothetical protein